MRRNVTSSPFVRLLAAWGEALPGAARSGVAEPLAAWLGPLQAIDLCAAQQSLGGVGVALAAPQRAAQAQTLEAAVRSTRAELLAGLTPPARTAAPSDASLASYRKRYQALQRRMESKIDPLRLRCRQVLAQCHPVLAQLAQLDAALEQAFGAREKLLLGKLPALLERRFAHWNQEPPPASAAPAVAPAQATPWRVAFEQDLRALAQAELHMRLEPVVGLVQALAQPSEPLP